MCTFAHALIFITSNNFHTHWILTYILHKCVCIPYSVRYELIRFGYGFLHFPLQSSISFYIFILLIIWCSFLVSVSLFLEFHIVKAFIWWKKIPFYFANNLIWLYANIYMYNYNTNIRLRKNFSLNWFQKIDYTCLKFILLMLYGMGTDSFVLLCFHRPFFFQILWVNFI